LGRLLLRQRFDLFDSERDNYFSGGGSVDGYRISVDGTHAIAVGELGLGAQYRRAESGAHGRSETYSLTMRWRLGVLRQGELRGEIEAYRQDLESSLASLPYTLTDNKSRGNGADWSAEVRYAVRSGVRADASIRGRHAEKRRGQVTMRAELVVEF
jgi:hypothetical protein